MRNFWRSESGASLVEFAILAPVMLVLLVGLIEVGRYTFFAILAANAARAGAAYGAQSTQKADDIPGMTNAAKLDGQSLSQWSVIANPLCSVNGSALGACSNPPPTGTIYYVSVQVNGTFPSLLHLPWIFKNGVPVSGKSVMRVASQ
ncbi:MAG: TadE/TadG family type IV pilus assembly protein [Candidatus Cybelea sp.]